MKMNRKRIYDSIIVFETDFQKTIVDTIIDNYYKEKYVLLIDARNFSIKIDGHVFKINLNGFKRTTNSIIDLIHFPSLYTKELLCTAFPGIACRLFPALIHHESLVLIDDGSGTPAILQNGIYLKTLNLKVRFIYASLITILLKGHYLKTTRSLIKGVSKYYSIYDFVNRSYSKYTKCIEIIHVNYFEKFKFDDIIEGQVGFVSSGLPNDKNSLLKFIIADCGKKAFYFPHPHENISKIDSNIVTKIVSPETILEAYFMSNGIPEILYGEPSTVFINLRQCGFRGNISIFHKQEFVHTPYYNIFSRLNIKMISIK